MKCLALFVKKKRLKALLHIKPRQNYKTTLRNKTHFKILFNSFPLHFKILHYESH